MVHRISRLIIIAGIAISFMVLNPHYSFAGSENEWGLAPLDSLWAEGNRDSTFGRMQSFKARMLRERRFGSGRQSEKAAAAPAPEISLASFQNSALGESELFLDTYAGQHTSLVFAVTQNECRLLELPGREDLKSVFTRLHELSASADSNPDSLRVASEEVSSLLLGGLDDLLADCDHIIFSADDVFNLVPTSMLLPREKDVEFSRVPSAAILMDLKVAQSSRAPLGGVRTLAVGAPGANGEFDALDSTYKDVTLIKPNANGALPELALLGSFDLIHVAAQSVGDDCNAWQSAIKLHPANPDMMIRASDLLGLKLDTRMVVLASCSSAAGRIQSGEGVQELASAFLSTGVPAVVVALWPVDDDATNFFMAAFYEGLCAGNNVAGALKFARETCQNDPVFNMPFHWGAFVLVGDSQVSIPLELKPDINVGRILASLLGVFLAIIFMLVRSHKRSSS